MVKEVEEVGEVEEVVVEVKVGEEERRRRRWWWR